MDERMLDTQKHKVVIQNRETVSLTGVNDVLSFDATEILMETVMGLLMLRGKDLHVNRLSVEKGEIDIDGKIDSFAYAEEKNLATRQEGLWKRLFK